MNDKPDSKDPSEDDQEKLIDGAFEQVDELREGGTETVSASGSPAAGRADSRSVDPPSDSFTGYTIIRELHRGGQGVVYKAFQESTKRKVAIKVMKEGPFAGSADKARFDREVQILGQLSHPNIVTIHDTGLAAGTHYFVMDYISGQSLDTYMAGGDHSIEETLKLFGKICEAVNAAHLRGIIHRDLKPGNIRIDDSGEPHILDFGLAKVAAGDKQASMMTMTGQFLGSLPWASPEQAEAAPSKIDTRTDVYSLGVILYQMLTGKFPYDVIGNMRDVLDRIMKAEPARPSTIRKQINDEVETIVLKCLSKERDRRYQTAGELGRDVCHYLAGEPIEAKRDSFGYVLRKQLRRYRLPAAFAAAFVLLLIGATTISTVFYFREEEQRRIADAEATRADKEKAVAEAVRRANRQAHTLTEYLVNVLSRGVARADARDVAEKLHKIDERILPQEPEPKAAMHHLLGEALHHLGYNGEAAEKYRSAIALRKSALGEGHTSTLNTMRDLGVALRQAGELDRAEAVLREAVKIARRELGNEDQHALHLMGELAEVHYDQRRYDEAESLYVKTLEIRKRVLGKEHSRALSSMNNLARLYFRQRRYAEAEALYVKILELRKRVLGEEHPDTLDSMNNLAILYRNQRRYEEAEPLYVKTLAIEKRVLGEEHRDTLASMNNLAILYMLHGRYDEAEALSLKTLEIAKRVLGEEHRGTLSSMGNLARLYDDQGRYAEAELLIVKTLEIKKRVDGEDDPSTLASITRLGKVYLSMKRYDDARGLFERSLPIKRRVLGMRHPFTRYALEGLAEAYDGLDRGDDALPLWRELQEFQLAQVEDPDASAQVLNEAAWNLLTNEHAELRDPETALRLARDACAMTHNANHAFLDTLALAQHLTGDTPAAIETEKKALSLLAPDAPGRGDYEATLARFEAALKEANTAEEPGGG